MIAAIKNELLTTYKDSLTPPYIGGMREWSEENIELTSAYSIPGKLDFSISPHLHFPMELIDDLNIQQVNLGMATQVGKSLISEAYILFSIINKPGTMFRVFPPGEMAEKFSETRFLPLLKNCKPIKALLKFDRFSAKKSGVNLPHMSVVITTCGEGLAHGSTVKHLLVEELHVWTVGQFEKFIARTRSFGKKRKIIVASQPNDNGSEYHGIFNSGKIYEYGWTCPNCKLLQPYVWSGEREDGSYYGFNWDTVLNSDGSTNIAESSKTTWLECSDIKCQHKVHNTPIERRNLLHGGKYICVKNDGDPSVASVTAPQFVNVDFSFQDAAAQYMIAKLWKKQTFLDDKLKIFVNQVLGKFYKADPILDISKIMVEAYDPATLLSDEKNWVTTMGVDVQRNGGVKYYVVWAWHKDGNKSKRVDFGIARTWEEIEAIRIKNRVLYPCLGVDSGDGENTLIIYQECIKHGQVIKVGGILQYVSWTPMKGDSKPHYKHKDNITRYYSEVSNQDTQFPNGSKYKGIPAPLILWATTPIKIILEKLREGKIEGVSFVVDRPDNDFDTHMFSEGLKEVIDKKSGFMVHRWVEIGKENHYLDATAMCLAQAIRANVFSPTSAIETELKKIELTTDAAAKS